MKTTFLWLFIAAFIPGATPALASGPACGVVKGTGAVTYTRDEGDTLAENSEELPPTHYTFGLVELGRPGFMLAESDGAIMLSKNSGCTWEQFATVNQNLLTLAAAGEFSAYGWSDNGNYFVRIDEDGPHEFRVPLTSILGVGVDPNDGRRVRIGGDLGDIFESRDGGASWTRIGRAPASNELTLAYRLTFDSHDIDRVMLGRSNDGAWASTDGGRTWTHSEFGLGGNINVFNFAISPVDPNVVWAMAIYIPYVDEPWGGRYIGRSTDGGRTFTAVYRQTNRVTIRNQPLMVAHPKDKNVLYFVFGTYFAQYGTDIYRLDVRTGQLRIRHNEASDVNAIVFSKSDPNVMYLGLESAPGFPF